jgi:hypothetical protein
MTGFTALLVAVSHPAAARTGSLAALSETLSEDLKRELRALERELTEPALAEALRLLDSPRFAEVTEAHVREVGQYRPIELAGERFFERAWSRSKEAGALLGFARLLGAAFVRQDLRRLRALAQIRDSGPEDDRRAAEPG